METDIRLPSLVEEGKQALFALGTVAVEDDAMEALVEAGQMPLPLLARHWGGDVGELSNGCKERVMSGLREGAEVVSAYRLVNGIVVWIRTAGDRSETVISIREPTGEWSLNGTPAYREWRRSLPKF